MAAQLEIYPRRDGRWAWRLRAGNRRIIATDGGQGYENVGDAHAIATRIVAGDFTAAYVTVTNHPDLSGEIMTDAPVVKYAVARRSKIITDLHTSPESAAAELEAIKSTALSIGITDQLKVVEVDVITTISEPRDYEPEPEGDDDAAESGEDESADATTAS